MAMGKSKICPTSYCPKPSSGPKLNLYQTNSDPRTLDLTPRLFTPKKKIMERGHLYNKTQDKNISYLKERIPLRVPLCTLEGDLIRTLHMKDSCIQAIV